MKSLTIPQPSAYYFKKLHRTTKTQEEKSHEKCMYVFFCCFRFILHPRNQEKQGFFSWFIQKYQRRRLRATKMIYFDQKSQNQEEIQIKLLTYISMKKGQSIYNSEYFFLHSLHWQSYSFLLHHQSMLLHLGTIFICTVNLKQLHNKQ